MVGGMKSKFLVFLLVLSLVANAYLSCLKNSLPLREDRSRKCRPV